jgi:hypothetical protein
VFPGRWFVHKVSRRVTLWQSAININGLRSLLRQGEVPELDGFETFWRKYCVQIPERPVCFFLQEG